MDVTRAGFLRGCATALVGAWLSDWRTVVHAATGDRPEDAAAPETDAAVFRSHLHTIFAIDDGRQLRLIRVIDGPDSHALEQYSLLFEEVSGAPVSGGIYTFRHSALGRMSLYITAIGAPPARVYEACVTRYVDPKERAWRTRS